MYIVISNSDPTPLYEQIKKQVINGIIEGKIRSGYPLPSIRALARELKVSVITVKKAYEDLENAGYIITRAGKGSFVAEASMEFAREEKLKMVEEKLTEGIKICRELNMSDTEIKKAFQVILKEMS